MANTSVFKELHALLEKQAAQAEKERVELDKKLVALLDKVKK
jgi:hypothetical protein